MTMDHLDEYLYDEFNNLKKNIDNETFTINLDQMQFHMTCDNLKEKINTNKNKIDTIQKIIELYQKEKDIYKEKFKTYENLVISIEKDYNEFVKMKNDLIEIKNLIFEKREAFKSKLNELKKGFIELSTLNQEKDSKVKLTEELSFEINKNMEDYKQEIEIYDNLKERIDHKKNKIEKLNNEKKELSEFTKNFSERIEMFDILIKILKPKIELGKSETIKFQELIQNKNMQIEEKLMKQKLHIDKIIIDSINEELFQELKELSHERKNIESILNESEEKLAKEVKKVEGIIEENGEAHLMNLTVKFKLAKIAEKNNINEVIKMNEILKDLKKQIDKNQNTIDDITNTEKDRCFSRTASLDFKKSNLNEMLKEIDDISKEICDKCLSNNMIEKNIQEIKCENEQLSEKLAQLKQKYMK